MRGERRLLRIGEYLIGHACRFLPAEMRDERRREWTAELPAILRDPDTRLAAHRAARMLRYAAGAAWGTARTSGSARGRLTVVIVTVVVLFTADILLLLVIDTSSAVKTPGDWVHYYGITAGIIYLAGFGGVLAHRIRRTDALMEGVRDAVLVWGDVTIPGPLLSRLLRAVGADRSDLPGKTGAPSPPAPAPGPTEPAASAEQAISMARDTAGRFYRVRWRPGYQTAEVDEFITRIEVTLTGGTRPGQAVTAADVDAVKFGTTRRGGYDEEVVDEALDHYAAGLARLALSPDSATGHGH
jgi:DivIVA domain-containing protein